jgi:hypothetical protein
MKALSLGPLTLLAALSIGLAGVAEKPADAHSVAVAAFNEQFGPGNAFEFVNSGSTSSFTSVAPIPVNLIIFAPNTFSPLPIQALLTITGTVSDTTIQIGSGLYQPLSNLDLTFVDQADPSITLFTADATNNGAAINNDPGFSSSTAGQTGALGATTTPTTGTPATVTFSSSFVNPAYFATQQNFSVNFSSIIDAASGANGPVLNLNGYLSSFAGSATGTFGAAPAPESTTLVGFGAMLALAAGAFFLGTRKQSALKA